MLNNKYSSIEIKLSVTIPLNSISVVFKYSQNIELREVGVYQVTNFEHGPHVLHNLKVQLSCFAGWKFNVL